MAEKTSFSGLGGANLAKSATGQVIDQALLGAVCMQQLTSGVAYFFFFSSRRRHTMSLCDLSSDVCSSDLSKEDLANLTDLQKRVAAAQDPQHAWRLNQAFHRAVIEMARSPRLPAVLTALAGIVPGNFFELVPGSVEAEKQGTAAILRGVKRGDGERASAEYAKMMRRQ